VQAALFTAYLYAILQGVDEDEPILLEDSDTTVVAHEHGYMHAMDMHPGDCPFLENNRKYCRHDSTAMVTRSQEIYVMGY
jgi:Fe-S-cluster containining protein